MPFELMVNIEHVQHIHLVLLLLTLSIFRSAFTIQKTSKMNLFANTVNDLQHLNSSDNTLNN